MELRFKNNHFFKKVEIEHDLGIVQKWSKKHLVGNTVWNHSHLAEIKWLCQHIMWWWFLTYDNTVQRETFNRISMNLLMRQRGSYTKTCFWRTNLNEDTDLATPVPASFSLFSTGFAVLHHSSEASAGSLELLLKLECISCVPAWGYRGACVSANLMSRTWKAVWPQPKVSCLCMVLALERSSEAPSGCTAWCRGEGQYSS